MVLVLVLVCFIGGRVGKSFGSLIFLYETTSSLQNWSHLLPNKLANLLDVEILEL